MFLSTDSLFLTRMQSIDSQILTNVIVRRGFINLLSCTLHSDSERNKDLYSKVWVDLNRNTR